MYFESKLLFKYCKIQSERVSHNFNTIIFIIVRTQNVNLLDNINEDSFPQGLSYIRGLLLSQYKKIN